MEKNGIYIDTEKLAETTARFKEELAQVQDEIYELAGETSISIHLNNWV